MARLFLATTLTIKSPLTRQNGGMKKCRLYDSASEMFLMLNEHTHPPRSKKTTLDREIAMTLFDSGDHIPH